MVESTLEGQLSFPLLCSYEFLFSKTAFLLVSGLAGVLFFVLVFELVLVFDTESLCVVQPGFELIV